MKLSNRLPLVNYAIFSCTDKQIKGILDYSKSGRVPTSLNPQIISVLLRVHVSSDCQLMNAHCSMLDCCCPIPVFQFTYFDGFNSDFCKEENCTLTSCLLCSGIFNINFAFVFC